jgi:hypothetical protein
MKFNLVSNICIINLDEIKFKSGLHLAVSGNSLWAPTFHENITLSHPINVKY